MVHPPRTQVGITVTVVFGIGAVVFDATGALLYPRSRAPPVAVPLVGSSDPPGKRDTIWEQTQSSGVSFHTQSHIYPSFVYFTDFFWIISKVLPGELSSRDIRQAYATYCSQYSALLVTHSI